MNRRFDLLSVGNVINKIEGSNDKLTRYVRCGSFIFVWFCYSNTIILLLQKLSSQLSLLPCMLKYDMRARIISLDDDLTDTCSQIFVWNLIKMSAVSCWVYAEMSPMSRSRVGWLNFNFFSASLFQQGFKWRTCLDNIQNRLFTTYVEFHLNMERTCWQTSLSYVSFCVCGDFPSFIRCSTTPKNFNFKIHTQFLITFNLFFLSKNIYHFLWPSASHIS